MMQQEELRQSYNTWQRRIFFTLWVTYGFFYLCRLNMSIALPSIMKEFNCSRADVGLVGSAFFIVYAFGQFINGQLGDKFGARKFIALGIVASALLNVVCGFTTTLLSLTILWAANGYFQSIGWSPSIKTLANWFPQKKRGKISGLYGTSFQAGSVLSWLLGGYLCVNYGWRYAFRVSAALFLLCGLYFYLRCRNSPEEIGLPAIEEYEGQNNNRAVDDPVQKPRPNRDEHLGFRFTISRTLGNPRIWCVGVAHMLMGLVTFGFLYWAPSYLFEIEQTTISTVALRAIIYPLTGSLGILATGWLSDRFFNSVRAPVICLMSLACGAFVLLYSRIPGSGILCSVLCLGGIGFTTFGAHTTMVSTVPMDYGTRKAASSAAGFIGALGYLGATVAGVGTGLLADRFGWNYAFYFWASGAFAAGILMAFLWKYVPPKTSYM